MVMPLKLTKQINHPSLISPAWFPAIWRRARFADKMRAVIGSTFSGRAEDAFDWWRERVNFPTWKLRVSIARFALLFWLF